MPPTAEIVPCRAEVLFPGDGDEGGAVYLRILQAAGPVLSLLGPENIVAK